MAVVFGNLQGQRAFLVQFALLLLGGSLYILAVLSNGWFIVHPTSYYGVWSVTFCDFLRCQDISAVFNDEPDWYHLVQLLNIIGVTSVLLSVLFSFFHITHLPSRLVQYSAGAVSFFCIISVISISMGLFIFYSRLIEDSPVNHPHVSWGAALAGMACLLQLMAAVLVSQNK